MDMSYKLQTIIDNRDPNTVLESLQRLLPESRDFDVATGYFEIGSLLALESFWNSLESVRILMGDETQKRTKKELVESIRKESDLSIERRKEHDDSLHGLSAVQEALRDGRIQTKVYTKARFHAKAMLMRMKPPHLSDYGIVGSSNFTEPGLCRNLELNLLTTEQHQLHALRSWYEGCWNEAEEVKEALLQVIEPHTRLYAPFEVYVKALYEYYLGKEMPTSSWEESESRIYPILDDLQKAGYKQALYIAEQWGGALICDGVGFGKTYIALMLIERFLHERKRVALVVPKSARESVWEVRLRQYLSDFYGGPYSGNQILLLNHTDLPRESLAGDLEKVRQRADVVIVDEGHHFRTPNAQRSQKLYQMIEYGGRNKKVFFLTATPVNNSLFDILHLMEYFTRKERNYFQRLGINDTRSYFVKKERAVEVKMGKSNLDGDDESAFPDFDIAEAEKVLREDSLFGALVVQRSREYSKQYFKRVGNGEVRFPERDAPRVAKYKLASVYKDLFPKIKQSFSKETPFLELTLYNPEEHRKDRPIDPKTRNRERQILTLIRVTMLKRMESSYKAFEASCEDMLMNMARFLRYHSSENWELWKIANLDFWNTIETHWKERFQDSDEEKDIEEEDLLPEPKQRLSAEEFSLVSIVDSVLNDMAELVTFLRYIHERLKDGTDAKLQSLIDLMSNEEELRTQKVIIFTQYRDTARYLYRELKDRIPGPIEELDSTSKKRREVVIKRFSPYYNCTQEELHQYLAQPIRVLISTDVLSEGLNLQDAHLLINYDLHWNPVRLMQRIGRVDRRLDVSNEKRLGRANCKVRYWNFLPPDELDDMLDLYQRVSGKLLRISKTLGIEGRKVLSPEDDFEALRNFNTQYDGIMPFEERMRLLFVDILKTDPWLRDQLPRLPKRLFSSKEGIGPSCKGVFAAYRYPPREVEDGSGTVLTVPGECKWYFHRYDSDDVVEDLQAIHEVIESQVHTPRVGQRAIAELRQSLNLIEQRKVHPELRNMQAMVGEKATLVCWMEVA
jgi:superfamily II DNA or RNA helicase